MPKRKSRHISSGRRSSRSHKRSRMSANRKASKALRIVRALRSSRELKFKESNGQLTTDQTGANTITLNSMTQDIKQNGRIGDKISMNTIYIRMQINSATGSAPHKTRVIIGYTPKLTTPAALNGSVFQDFSNDSYNYRAQRQTNPTTRYKILYDKVVTLNHLQWNGTNALNESSKDVWVKIKLRGLKVQFVAESATVLTGALWFGIINQQATGDIVPYNYRLTYFDD